MKNKPLTTVQKIRQRNLRALVARYKTQLEASKNLPLSPAQISDYLRGRRGIAERLALKIEIAANLKNGSLSREFTISNNLNDTKDSTGFDLGDMVNTETLRYCPLLDWKDVISWERVLKEGEYKERLLTEKSHSNKAFALPVVGDAMTSRSGSRPSYLNGDVIFIDPEQKDNAVDQSPILAMLTDKAIPERSRAVFRILVIQGNDRFLKPLNDSYPIMHDDFEIIGVVIGGAYSS